MYNIYTLRMYPVKYGAGNGMMLQRAPSITEGAFLPSRAAPNTTFNRENHAESGFFVALAGHDGV